MPKDYVHLSKRLKARKKLPETSELRRSRALAIVIILALAMALIATYPKWQNEMKTRIKFSMPAQKKQSIRFDFYAVTMPRQELLPCFLQLGTYADLASAKQYQAELIQQGFQPVIRQVLFQRGKIYRVQLKNVNTEKNCQSMQAVLEAKQIPSIIIYREK